jgi:hypothetical protein
MIHEADEPTDGPAKGAADDAGKTGQPPHGAAASEGSEPGPTRGEPIDVEWQECADDPRPHRVTRLKPWTNGPGEARRPRRLLRPALAVAASMAACGAVFAVGLVIGRAQQPAAAQTALVLRETIRPQAPTEPDTGQQLTKMTSEIRTLSASLETMRGRLETVRANSDTMGASFEALRLAVDHTRPTDDIRALRKSLEALKSGLDQTKADSTAALAQVAQKVDAGAKLGPITERLDRLDRDQTVKLAQIGERLERLERHGVSADITGSIPHTAPPAALVPPPKPPAPLASLPVPKPASLLQPAQKPVTIPGLVVRDVEGGQALIEGREGLFEIGAGDFIPGVGRVEAIERRGRDWVVVTNRGIIESQH